MTKLTYKQRVSLTPRSPETLSPSVLASPSSSNIPMRYSQRGLNVNAQELKRILSRSRSKVKEHIHKQAFSPVSTLRMSETENVKTPIRSKAQTEYVEEEVRNEINGLLSGMSARMLQKFFNRKLNTISNCDI